MKHLLSLYLNCSVAKGVVGYMAEQQQSENDLATALVLRTNFEGPAIIMGILANYFETSGCLVGISSVAGIEGERPIMYTDLLRLGLQLSIRFVQ